MAPKSELTGLDFVADILQPLQLVVWGELAIRYLGVPVVHSVSASFCHHLSFPPIIRVPLTLLTHHHRATCSECGTMRWP